MATIETVSGILMDPTNPQGLVVVTDIAWALSRISRFAGHTITEVPYNVAQHCIYCSKLLRDLILHRVAVEDILSTDSPWYQTFVDVYNQNLLAAYEHIEPERLAHVASMMGLFHDGHEAYFGDIPSPIKHIPEIKEVITFYESILDREIYDVVGIADDVYGEMGSKFAPVWGLVKFVDKYAQAVEAYQFMPSRGRDWNLPKPSLTYLQRFDTPLSALQSYERFMDEFYMNEEYLKAS